MRTFSVTHICSSSSRTPTHRSTDRHTVHAPNVIHSNAFGPTYNFHTYTHAHTQTPSHTLPPFVLQACHPSHTLTHGDTHSLTLSLSLSLSLVSPVFTVAQKDQLEKETGLRILEAGMSDVSPGKGSLPPPLLCFRSHP